MNAYCAIVNAHCSLCPAVDHAVAPEARISWVESGASMEPDIDEQDYVRGVYAGMVARFLLDPVEAAYLVRAYECNASFPLPDNHNCALLGACHELLVPDRELPF